MPIPLMLVALNGVVALSSQYEVSGNELGTLVQELVKRVLGVRCRFAEENRTGRVLDIVARARDGLAVRFHGQLLEVSWETVQVLVKSESLLG